MPDRDPHTDLSLNPYRPEQLTSWEHLAGPSCAELHRYWSDKRGGEEAPAWADFVFIELYRVAPCMVVYDVAESGDIGQLRYRFVGTRIVEYRRHRRLPDPTGRTFAETDRAYDPSPLRAAYAACVASRAPVLTRGAYRTENAQGLHERLTVPWLIDGRVARLTAALDRLPDASVR